MNLLNSRLSKGQVKYRLRKKLQEEECAVRFTEALGHRGSEWELQTLQSLIYPRACVCSLLQPASTEHWEPQWTLVQVLIYHSHILTSQLYPVPSPSLTLVYFWLVSRVIWLLSDHLGFPWLRGLHLHCLPREQWQEGSQVLFMSTRFPTQDLMCF